MSYIALYRKFRPTCFEDVKGQEHIVTTLKNQIKSERTSHAYLFCGTRGTGKTTIAKIFAKAVNCEHPVDGSPCGECASCKAIASGSSMNVIEIDAASNNGVDNIREIVDEVAYSPAEGKYKVYIIDEVHMLSIGAFNALLKTLEEPPSYVIFILATTEVHKLPITILSRCQRYDFKRITIDTITNRLKELTDTEQVKTTEKALRYIAKVGDGSMRDAISLLDQCMAFHYGQELTYDKVLDVLGAVDTEVFSRLLRIVLEGNVAGTISLIEEVVMQGRELVQFTSDFTWYLRNLLLIKSADGVEDIIDVSTENLNRLKEEAQMAENDVIMRYIRILSELSGQLRYASQKRILVEITLIKLCKPSMETDTLSLTDRIRQVEDKIEKGIPMVAVAGMDIPRAQTLEVNNRAPLPKAIPEDLKEIVNESRWASIMSNINMPMKGYLKNSYPSLAGDNSLMVVIEDGLSVEYFKTAAHKEALEQAISDSAGKEIKITVQSSGEGRNPHDIYPDLRNFVDNKINMQIEDADEDELEEFPE